MTSNSEFMINQLLFIWLLFSYNSHYVSKSRSIWSYNLNYTEMLKIISFDWICYLYDFKETTKMIIYIKRHHECPTFIKTFKSLNFFLWHTVLFCLNLNSWCWMQRIKCLRIKPFGQSTTEKYVMCFLMNRG